MNDLMWHIGKWYDLRNDETPTGQPIKELFLSMTVCEAVLYKEITDEKPFLVTMVDSGGNVSQIQRHDGHFISMKEIEEYDWSSGCVISEINRNFFEEVEAPEMEVKTDPTKILSQEEKEPLTTTKKVGKLDLSFLDSLHGLWSVSFIPTDLGRSLGVGTYNNITDDSHLWAIDRDIRSSKVKLQDKIYMLEKQLQETKELLFSI